MALLPDSAPDRLANPPGGMRPEAGPPPPVVLLHSDNQANISFLDQILQHEATANKLFRHTHNEPQVGLNQLPPRLFPLIDTLLILERGAAACTVLLSPALYATPGPSLPLPTGVVHAPSLVN